MTENTVNISGNEAGCVTKRLPEPPPPDSFVYLIYSRGLIKIGFSKDPFVRLDKLRGMNASPLSLIMLIRGTRFTERRLHDAFEEDRYRGEWFRVSDAIRSFLGRFPNNTIIGMPPSMRLEWAEAHPDATLGP